jgi:hypothetical protein
MRGWLALAARAAETDVGLSIDKPSAFSSFVHHSSFCIHHLLPA